jgi:hypothetical protein
MEEKDGGPTALSLGSGSPRAVRGGGMVFALIAAPPHVHAPVRP